MNSKKVTQSTVIEGKEVTFVGTKESFDIYHDGRGNDSCRVYITSGSIVLFAIDVSADSAQNCGYIDDIELVK